MQIDVGKVLDEGRWTLCQKFLVLCTALAIVLDGLDLQLLPNAVPRMMDEWKLPRDAFSTALGIAGIGMMIGGAVGGWLGDRIGRRTTLLLSVFSFAAFTGGVYFVQSMSALDVVRFLAGLGLGAAMPTAAALASEYVPVRRRPFAVTLTIVCVPLGGMLAGQIAQWIGDWRMLFVVGGVVPLALGVLLLVALPESPRYLARRPAQWARLVSILRSLGHEVPQGAEFTEAGDDIRRHGSLADLFKSDFIRDTLALFGSFFFCLLANYLAFLTLTIALKALGFSPAQGSDALKWWNFGGVGGALLGAFLIHRLGSRITMLGLSVIAIISAFAMAGMHFTPENMTLLLVMCVVLGGMLNAVQTTMYALAAHVYPTEIRGRGIGSAVAVGRIGSILAPFIGNYALSINKGSTAAYFSTFGICMIAVFITLAIVRRHIERAVSQAVPMHVHATVE